MTPMTDLIARLDAATKGGRELDRAVREAVGYSDVGSPLHYTTSMEDALTLLPEGWAPWDLIFGHCTPFEFNKAPALAMSKAAMKVRAP